MASEDVRRMRPIDVLGGLCVVATILLTSWVDVSRAEDADEAMMSVDPALAAPAVQPAEAPSEAPAQAPPTIVQLNTRGYNYGPPPGEIDRAAMGYETGAPPAAPTPIPTR